MRPRLVCLETRDAASAAAKAGVDIIIIARQPAPGAEVAERVDALGAALERSRSKRATGVATIAPASLGARDEMDGARALLDARAADGAVVTEVESALWIAGDRRIFSATNGATYARIPDALDEKRVREALATMASCLERDLGIARPRLGVAALDPDGDLDRRAIAPACESARGSGLDVAGPLPIEALLERRVDAILATGRDVAALLLALSSEPVLALMPGRAVVSVRDAKGDSGRALAAALALAADVARRRGGLVEEREEAEKRAREKVAVTSRAPRDDERCPYCRRAFEPDEPRARCARCETAHHRACLHEHGKCTIHGCSSDRARFFASEVPIASLAGDGHAEFAFVPLEGDGGAVGEPRVLRVEAALDDPGARGRERQVALELGDARFARGGLVTGAIATFAPRAFKALGGTFRLRAALGRGEKMAPILDREAIVCGNAQAGVVTRISGLLGQSALVEIPKGARRYPFSFRLAHDHPVSLRARGEGVATKIEVTLVAAAGGSLTAEATIEVAAS